LSVKKKEKEGKGTSVLIPTCFIPGWQEKRKKRVRHLSLSIQMNRIRVDWARRGGRGNILPSSLKRGKSKPLKLTYARDCHPRAARPLKEKREKGGVFRQAVLSAKKVEGGGGGREPVYANELWI